MLTDACNRLPRSIPQPLEQVEGEAREKLDIDQDLI